MTNSYCSYPLNGERILERVISTSACRFDATNPVSQADFNVAGIIFPDRIWEEASSKSIFRRLGLMVSIRNAL